MFEFTPYTEEEVQDMARPALLEKGEGSFEVIGAIGEENGGQLKSKSSGNPMLKLSLKVWDSKGNQGFIDDYLVFSTKVMYKIKHFWDSVGKPDVFKAGKFTAQDCLGLSGKLKIDIQKGQKKPEEKWSGYEPEFYPDKNSVKDYMPSIPGEAKISGESEEKFHDDDVPW